MWGFNILLEQKLSITWAINKVCHSTQALCLSQGEGTFYRPSSQIGPDSHYMSGWLQSSAALSGPTHFSGLTLKNSERKKFDSGMTPVALPPSSKSSSFQMWNEGKEASGLANLPIGTRQFPKDQDSQKFTIFIRKVKVVLQCCNKAKPSHFCGTHHHTLEKGMK